MFGIGAQFSKTDLFRLVIGSEVFDKLGEEGMAMERIALKVAKKWAGSDYVATGSLISFLKTAVPSAQHFLVRIIKQPQELSVHDAPMR